MFLFSLNELVLHKYSNYKYSNYLILENTVEQIETPFQRHQAKLNCSLPAYTFESRED